LQFVLLFFWLSVTILCNKSPPLVKKDLPQLQGRSESNMVAGRRCGGNKVAKAVIPGLPPASLAILFMNLKEIGYPIDYR